MYWYAKNVGRAAGFPWNAGVTVENLLPADPVFHSSSAPVQYTCFNRQEICSVLLLWLLKLHLCLSSKFSILGDLICLSLLFLLAVRTVCVLISPIPAHLQP